MNQLHTIRTRSSKVSFYDPSFIVLAFGREYMCAYRSFDYFKVSYVKMNHKLLLAKSL